jgi:predicted transcriptional regulator
VNLWEAGQLEDQDQSTGEEMEVVSDKRSGTIQSVSIAARFLKILANAENELPLGEVAKRAGTGGSTAHRYLQSLVKEGLATEHWHRRATAGRCGGNCCTTHESSIAKSCDEWGCGDLD